MIIHRYLNKEVGQTWLAVSTVLLVIILSSVLVRFLREAAAGALSGEAVFYLLGLKVLIYMELLLPVAFFLAVMLALGRWYRDNEMGALAACGVSPMSLYKPLLWLAVPLAVAMAVLALYVAPWAARLGYQISERLEKSPGLSAVIAGRFKEVGNGRLVFYVERVSKDRERMHNIFIQSRRHGTLNLLSAASAYQTVDQKTGERFVVMLNGYRYEGLPGQANFKIVRFAKQVLRIPRQGNERVQYRSDAASTAALWRARTKGDMAELEWRISMPLSALLLTLLAVPLGRSSPRQGRYGQLVAAILVYVVYVNMLGVAQVWIEHGNISPRLGVWWVHGALLLFTAALLLYQNGSRWLRDVLLRRVVYR